MEILIDLAGRSLKVGRRNVAVAVSKVGFIHVRSTGPTAIISLQPQLASEVTIAAAAYIIADLNPQRTIVAAWLSNPRCWVFSGYALAVRKIAALRHGLGDIDGYTSPDAIEYLL